MLAVATRRSLLSLLALSVTLNVAAAWHLLHASPQQGKTQSQSEFGATPIALGAKAPEIYAAGPEGRRLIERPGQRALVLYVMAPTCGWCVRNTPNIKKLAESRASDYKFIGLSLAADGLPSYLRDHPLPFPVYVADQATIDGYGLGTTPSTIVISQAGRVAKKWNGAYAPAWIGTVEGYFGVKLPGLAPGDAAGNGH